MDLIGALIELVRLPFEAAKRMNEESSVGQSDLDRKSLRFWKWFAWIATAIIICIAFSGWLVWNHFFA